MARISSAEHPRLYRAISDKRWLKLRSAAFRLRKPSERFPSGEPDLSLILFPNCTKSVCAAGLVNYCGGEFVLETDAVLAVAAPNDWEVDKDGENHASILGLPLYGSNRQLIEDAAEALADLVVNTQFRPTTD